MKKWLKRGLLAVAFLATLIVLFYAEEDWRGARELARVKKELEAKGESLDPKALIPPPIPDEINVAAAPIFVELYEKDNSQDREKTRFAQMGNFFRRRNDLPAPGLPAVGSPHAFSLVAWQKWLTGKENSATSVADAQAGLEKVRPVADEVEAALARPGIRWPVTSPDNPFIERRPYMNAILNAVRFFDLRACVEIEAGNGEAALHDLGVLFRLSEIVQHQFIIGYLVQASCDVFSYGVISDGLQKEVWDDSQLVRIEEMLSRKAPLADFCEAMRQERLGAIQMYAVSLQELLNAFRGDQLDPKKLALSWWQKALWAPFLLRPRGWQKLDEANVLDKEQKGWLDTVDPEKGVVDVVAVEKVEAELKKDQESVLKGLVRPLSTLGLEALTMVQIRAASTQATLAETKTACALERWRLRNGTFPATLEQLVPDFLSALPVDPIGGDPFHCVGKEDGYLLYSIGWNQKDDGGVIVRQPNSTRPDLKEGDWTWASRPDLYKFAEEKAP